MKKIRKHINLDSIVLEILMVQAKNEGFDDIHKFIEELLCTTASKFLRKHPTALNSLSYHRTASRERLWPSKDNKDRKTPLDFLKDF